MPITAAEVEVIVKAQMDKFRAEMKKGRKELKDFADDAGDGARKVGSETEKILGHVSKMAKNMAASVGLSFASMKLFQFGRDAVQAAAGMDSLKRGLTAVMGSAKLAASEMAKLREVAKLPGLGFREAVEGSTRLQATGMSAREARDALMGFGNALATVGKGKADLDGVILALGQIQSKGKVSAEEINQIAERVPQIRKIMLSAFGTADTEVLQKAKISSKEFVNAITSELLKIPKVTGGIQNDMENMSDQIDASMTEAGNAMLPLVKTTLDMLVPALKSVTAWFRELSPTTKNWIVGATLAVAVLGPLAMGFGAVANGVRALIALRGAYVATMAAETAANAATAASAGTAAGAIGALKLATLGLLALAAVPIIITVKAVYDMKAAVDDAERAMDKWAANSKGVDPETWIANQRRKGDQRPKNELWEAYKRTKYAQDFHYNTARYKKNSKAFEQRQEAEQMQKEAMAALRKRVSGASVPKVNKSKGGRSGVDEYASLKDELYEATKAAALYGNELESVGLAYDLQHKKMKPVEAMYRKLILNMVKAKEVKEAQSETSKKLIEMEADAMKGLSEAAEAAMAKEAEGRAKANEWAQETLKALREEYADKVEISRVDKVKLELAKEQNKWLDEATQKQLILKADENDRTEAAGRFFGAYVDGYAGLTAMMAKAMIETKAEKDAMAAMAEEARQAWAMQELESEFDSFMETVGSQAQIVHDAFMDMFDSLFQEGFGGFFNNVLGGFQRMLAEMARQYLASQVSNLLSRVIGGLVSGIGAAQGLGSKSVYWNGGEVGLGSRPGNFLGGGRAVGGPVLSNRAVLVGERGPELFVPSGNGRILTAGQTSGSGGPVVVNMTVNTPDAGSFRASQGQIAEQAGHAIRRALNKG